jgi:hypothetical protein
MKTLTLLASAFLTASAVQGAIIPFDLVGAAGSGLRSGSEPTLPFATQMPAAGRSSAMAVS